MPKYDASADPSAVARQQEIETAKQEEARRVERRRWKELEETARRCVKIAELLWGEHLTKAQSEQEALAVQMRDRAFVNLTKDDGDGDVPLVGEIPVPLFTPRDRLQFLKEFSTTLLISADRRNLPATPEAKRDPTAPEAAAGVEETSDAEASALAAAGEP